MEEKDILKSRIKELSSRCESNGFVTHTEFLSMSEQALFYSILKEEHVSLLSQTYMGASYFLYGGHNEDDRKILFFYPYYLSSEEAFLKEQEGETIACLHVYPKNVKFADTLSHRDYLGALMHLGFKREMFGDILSDGTEGYVFLLKSVSEQVKEELVKIRHTDVECEIIPLRECPLSPKFEERTVNVPSLRLDCILGEVYHLSRRDAQILIGSENVFVNGMTIKDNSHTLKENDRVSVAGKGKFIYLGQGSVSKKGRLFVKVKVFC